MSCLQQQQHKNTFVHSYIFNKYKKCIIYLQAKVQFISQTEANKKGRGIKAPVKGTCCWPSETNSAMISGKQGRETSQSRNALRSET